MRAKEHAINTFFITGVKNTTFFLLNLGVQKPFTMQKEEYFSPLVSTDELEWEGILCASSGDDDAGLPGSDFDDSTIFDGDDY